MRLDLLANLFFEEVMKLEARIGAKRFLVILLNFSQVSFYCLSRIHNDVTQQGEGGGVKHEFQCDRGEGGPGRGKVEVGQKTFKCV